MAAKSRKTSHRQSRSKRKTNVRDLRESFLIVCEGEKTEPAYFRSFDVLNANVYVVGAGCDPLDVVEKALELKEKAAEENPYNQVWAVFDRNSFPAERFNSAMERARNNRVQVAYSNEAFELWYVLHFEYLNTGISRQDYVRKLSRRLDNPYKKNSNGMYDALLPYQSQGIQNARKLLECYEQPCPERDNPSTTVHLLVEQLNRFLRGQ
jgi:hypothetical protein